MDKAQLFDEMLYALVGKEELFQMRIQNADNHPRFCPCEVCKYQRHLLFVDLLRWENKKEES
jgi:hypothetical protein